MNRKFFIITIIFLSGLIALFSCKKKEPEIFNNSPTLVWTCATPSAPWLPREGHTVVVFDNKIWVIGGGSGNIVLNDVWCSSDGVNWTCTTESAPWSRRCGHTSVVFDSKIWLIGGGGSLPKSDVWFSSDGVNWTCATESAPWSIRDGHTSVVFDNRMWVFGGHSLNGNFPEYSSDVWYSIDGINWTCVSESAAWEHRNYSTSLVLDNKIWLFGGGNEHSHPLKFCDVWNSADGKNWNCITDSAGWTARRAHTIALLDNKVWIMGGLAYWKRENSWGFSQSNDIWFVDEESLIQWSNVDSAPFHCLTDSAPWGRREYSASVVFDNKIWVLGGQGTSYPCFDLNDVWYGEIVYGER